MQVRLGESWEMARGTEDVQMTFRLSKPLYETLKKAGNVSVEARERLEVVSNEAETRWLQQAIANVAGTVAEFIGPWHKDPFAWAVMHAAVETLLTARKPEGEPVPLSIADRAMGRFMPLGSDPVTVGRTLALTELKR
jgi:hypothetical protein